MSKAFALMQQMMDDSTGALLRPVRKTVFDQQEDGSVKHRVFDKDGVMLSEETISYDQRLSLDARTKMGMSQNRFAEVLGISVRTLHEWEQGRREPSRAAKTLLKIASCYPQIVQEIMQQPAH